MNQPHRKFPIITLSRLDVEACGFNPDIPSDKHLKELASTLAEKIYRGGFWQSLSAHLEAMEVPSLKPTEKTRDKLLKFHGQELMHKQVINAFILCFGANGLMSRSEKGDLTSVMNLETKETFHEWTPPPGDDVTSSPAESGSPLDTGNTPQSSVTAA